MSTSRKLFVAIPLILLFAAILFTLPRIPQLNLDYRIGGIWKHDDLVSEMEFPIMKTEEQIEEEKARNAQAAVPYFKRSTDAEMRSLRRADFLELGDYSYIKQELLNALKEMYERGVVDDSALSYEDAGKHPQLIKIQYTGKKTAESKPVSEVLLLSEAREQLRTTLLDGRFDESLDSLLNATVLDKVVVNLEYDRYTTEKMRESLSTTISPTLGIVKAGTRIVSNGERVTAEQAQIIKSYEKEYSAKMRQQEDSNMLRWAGNSVLALVLVLLFFLSVRHFNPAVLNDNGEYLYLCLVFGIFIVLAITVPQQWPRYVCAVPFVLCALLLESFFDKRMVICVYGVILLPLMFFADYGPALFLMFLTAGVVSIITFARFNKGWRQFINALITFLVLVAVYLGLHAADIISGNVFHMLLMLLVSSFLCVAGYPLTYLFERIFNLVSLYRLSELCDTSNPLLRQLEQKAPGTFQHCLQVMNMASAVAGRIGANTQLIRAGALYHDIGKTRNPLCFVENESMMIHEGQARYHERIGPLQSAQDIIRHVTDGLDLAEKHHLPKVVQDFIASHHGDSTVSYFYTRYLNEGGSESDRALFSYPGPRPVTREQVILMLCDSIEAASRTLKDYSAASFDEFVERIVAGKVAEDQLSEAEISVKELGIVKSALKGYLAQMYHERIAYPERNKQ